MKNWIPTIVAICAIVALEIVALCKGVNGTAFSISIALVAGLGGYKAKDVRDKFTKKD